MFSRFLVFVIFVLVHSYAFPLQVSPTTRRFIDENNRERYFHGVNVVMKRYPYIPETSQFDSVLSFSEEDMQNLESWGLNIIRLGTQWPGYEPERGSYNESYIEILESIVNKSSQHNIFTLLDFHQDILNEKFCGEGIPVWAVKEPDYAWSFPRPLQLASYILDKDGIPTPEDCAKHDWLTYHFAFQTSAAYQSLYDNVDGIQDSFGSFWQRVANRFQNNDFVVGYELINEPFAGNVLENPLRLIPGYADRHNLMPMYDNLNKYIRQADPNHIIFFESVTWDDFLPMGFDHVPGGESYINQSAISYHYYSNVNFNVNWQVNSRIKDSKRLNSGMMCTEFGICVGSQAEFDDLENQLNVFDENYQSWIGWSYKSYGGITGDCGAVYDSDGKAKPAIVEKLSRTYAQAVAGRTKAMKFNNATKEFYLEYELCEECKGETEIYLNEDIHYTNGFDVVVSDEQKVQWYQPKKNRVHVKAMNSTNGGSVHLTIKRKGEESVRTVKLIEDFLP